MTTINTYFQNILDTQGFDAWAEATDELVALVKQTWDNEEETTFVTDWAKARNIDLTAGEVKYGVFHTYFEMWCWDNFED
jgi:hypothetical protein